MLPNVRTPGPGPEPLLFGLSLKEGLAGRKGHTSASIQTFRAAGAKPGLGQASQGGGGSDESPISPTHRLLCVPTASPRSGAGGARGHPLWEPAVLHEAGAGSGPGHAGSLALPEQPAESEFRARCVGRGLLDSLCLHCPIWEWERGPNQVAGTSVHPAVLRRLRSTSLVRGQAPGELALGKGSQN